MLRQLIGIAAAGLLLIAAGCDSSAPPSTPGKTNGAEQPSPGGMPNPKAQTPAP